MAGVDVRERVLTLSEWSLCRLAVANGDSEFLVGVLFAALFKGTHRRRRTH